MPTLLFQFQVERLRAEATAHEETASKLRALQKRSIEDAERFALCEAQFTLEAQVRAEAVRQNQAAVKLQRAVCARRTSLALKALHRAHVTRRWDAVTDANGASTPSTPLVCAEQTRDQRAASLIQKMLRRRRSCKARAALSEAEGRWLASKTQITGTIDSLGRASAEKAAAGRAQQQRQRAASCIQRAARLRRERAALRALHGALVARMREERRTCMMAAAAERQPEVVMARPADSALTLRRNIIVTLKSTLSKNEVCPVLHELVCVQAALLIKPQNLMTMSLRAPVRARLRLVLTLTVFRSRRIGGAAGA